MAGSYSSLLTLGALTVAGGMTLLSIACGDNPTSMPYTNNAPILEPKPPATLLHSATPLPTATLSPPQESTISPPEPIKTLEEKVMLDISKSSENGELTVSEMYNTVAGYMGIDEVNPDTPLDEFVEVYKRMQPIILEMNLERMGGVYNDHLIPRSLPDDAIPTKVKSDIHAYFDLKDVAKFSLGLRYNGQQITIDTLNNYIKTIVDSLVPEDVSPDRKWDLAIKITRELLEEDGNPQNNSGGKT